MLILILVAFIAVLATNVADNLAAKNIHSGFAFLNHRAGFEIGEQLIAYSSSDPLWKAFLTGLLNTLRISACTIVSATVLGVIVGLMRLSRNGVVRFLGAAHVEAYRNVPLLVLLLALYLVVTELLPGVRQAWHLGNWIYLSKTGLLCAVPLWGMKALLGALVVGVFGGWLAAKRLQRVQTNLIANMGGFLIFRYFKCSRLDPLRCHRWLGSSDCDTILNAWRSGDDTGISHSLAGTDAFYFCVDCGNRSCGG